MATGNGRRKPRRSGAAAKAPATKPQAKAPAPKPTPKPKAPEEVAQLKRDFTGMERLAQTFQAGYFGLILADGLPIAFFGSTVEAELAAWLEDPLLAEEFQRKARDAENLELIVGAGIEVPAIARGLNRTFVTLRDVQVVRTLTPTPKATNGNGNGSNAKPASKKRQTATKRTAASSKRRTTTRKAATTRKKGRR